MGAQGVCVGGELGSATDLNFGPFQATEKGQKLVPVQGRGQVLGPGEGAIVYGDSIAWEDQGVQGQGQGVQGKVGRIPGGRGQREKAGSLGWRRDGESWGGGREP